MANYDCMFENEDAILLDSFSTSTPRSDSQEDEYPPSSGSRAQSNATDATVTTGTSNASSSASDSAENRSKCM